MRICFEIIVWGCFLITLIQGQEYGRGEYSREYGRESGRRRSSKRRHGGEDGSNRLVVGQNGFAPMVDLSRDRIRSNVPSPIRTDTALFTGHGENLYPIYPAGSHLANSNRPINSNSVQTGSQWGNGGMTMFNAPEDSAFRSRKSIIKGGQKFPFKSQRSNMRVLGRSEHLPITSSISAPVLVVPNNGGVMDRGTSLVNAGRDTGSDADDSKYVGTTSCPDGSAVGPPCMSERDCMASHYCHHSDGHFHETSGACCNRQVRQSRHQRGRNTGPVWSRG